MIVSVAHWKLSKSMRDGCELLEASDTIGAEMKKLRHGNG